MKILGIVKEEGFIVSVTRHELKQIMGEGNEMYSSDFKDYQAGQSVSLGSCYQNAKEILSFYKEIKSSVASLKTASTKIIDFIASKENPIAAKIKSEDK